MNKTLKGTQINGPINIVRLEGEVNGVKKVLHVFFDVHLSPNYQTECSGVDNIDIHQFFRTEFNKLDKSKKYDFFFEDNPSLLYRDKFIYRGKYIEQVTKLFRQKRKSFNNVRFHYIDIRDYVSPEQFKYYDTLLNLSEHKIDTNTVNNNTEFMKVLLKHLENVYKISLNPIKKKKKKYCICI